MVEVLTKSRDQNASGVMQQQSSVADEYSEPAPSVGKNRSLSSRGGGHISNVSSKSASATATSGKGGSAGLPAAHRAASSSSSNAAATHRDNGNGSSKLKASITQTTPVGAFLTQIIGLQAPSSSSFAVANGAAAAAMTTSSSRRPDPTALAATNSGGGTKDSDAMTMAQYQAMLHAAPTSAVNNGGKQSKSTSLNPTSRSPPHQRPNHANTAATTAKTTTNAAVATSAAAIKAPRKKFKLVGLRERDAMKMYDSEAGEVYKSQLGDRSGFSWVSFTRFSLFLCLTAYPSVSRILLRVLNDHVHPKFTQYFPPQRHEPLYLTRIIGPSQACRRAYTGRLRACPTLRRQRGDQKDQERERCSGQFFEWQWQWQFARV